MGKPMEWKKAILLATGVVTSLGTAQVGHAVTYDLVAEQTSVTLPDGTTVPMWGFGLSGGAPTIPGPALVVPPGDTTLSINLTNNLGVPVSIVIPGQTAAMSPVLFTDAEERQRVRSFTAETAPAATLSYTWTGLKPGTYLYHSGTHPQVQVQMGLYGTVKHDTATGQIYPGITYDNETVVFYSEIDPALHAAIGNGAYGAGGGPTSTVDYAPRYFLVNGEPHTTASLPLTAGYAGERTLVRFINAGLKTHVPLLNGQYLSLVAEDGKPYPYPREQYSVFLPALKTVDAVLVPDAAGKFALFDGRLDLTTDGFPDGGLLTFLEVSAARVDAPVAVDDLYATDEDVALTVPAPGVLENDTGTAPLSALLVQDATNGTLSLAADGSFTYSPNANYAGGDSFTYRASDGANTSTTATVSLTVNPVNDAPAALADGYTVVAGGTLTVNAPGVLGNDSDPDTDPLTASLVNPPAEGVLTFAADGSFTYAAPATAGTYTFDYTASDGAASSTPATVTIAVMASSAPVAVDDNVSTSKNVALPIVVLANDYDPDTAADPGNTLDPASVRVGNDLLSVITQRKGTATVNPDGTITYTPRLNFRGTDNFTYTVRDTTGLISNTATVRVNVK